MKIDSHRYLWGPNAWASVAVLDATVRMASTGDGLGHLNRAVAAIDAALPERAAVFGPFQVGAAESPEELRLLAEVALALQGVARSPQMHL